MTKFVAEGVVPEPIVDQDLDFGMEFSGVPATGTITVNATVTIEIRNKSIDVPFIVHFIPGAKTVFNTASRISAP
jgi:hypothetical protein